MRLSVLCFGPTREWVPGGVLAVTAHDGATVADLRRIIDSLRPGASAYPIRIAVNRAFADDAAVLRSTDEIALIAPVSGG